jgi:hypothetical protein
MVTMRQLGDPSIGYQYDDTLDALYVSLSQHFEVWNGI